MSGAAVAGIVVVIAVIVMVVSTLAAARRRRLQQSVDDRAGAHRQRRHRAEAELASRGGHAQQLGIRPLTPAARARYGDQWTAIQRGSATSHRRESGTPNGWWSW